MGIYSRVNTLVNVGAQQITSHYTNTQFRVTNPKIHNTLLKIGLNSFVTFYDDKNDLTDAAINFLTKKVIEKQSLFAAYLITC